MYLNAELDFVFKSLLTNYTTNKTLQFVLNKVFEDCKKQIGKYEDYDLDYGKVVIENTFKDEPYFKKLYYFLDPAVGFRKMEIYIEDAYGLSFCFENEKDVIHKTLNAKFTLHLNNLDLWAFNDLEGTVPVIQFTFETKYGYHDIITYASQVEDDYLRIRISSAIKTKYKAEAQNLSQRQRERAEENLLERVDEFLKVFIFSGKTLHNFYSNSYKKVDQELYSNIYEELYKSNYETYRGVYNKANKKTRNEKKEDYKQENKQEQKQSYKQEYNYKEEETNKNESHNDDEAEPARVYFNRTDFYKILEVPENATQEQIEKAYRKLVHIVHPDLKKSTSSEAKMKLVNSANDVLSNPKTRKLYDEYLSENRGKERN